MENVQGVVTLYKISKLFAIETSRELFKEEIINTGLINQYIDGIIQNGQHVYDIALVVKSRDIIKGQVIFRVGRSSIPGVGVKENDFLLGGQVEVAKEVLLKFAEMMKSNPIPFVKVHMENGRVEWERKF